MSDKRALSLPIRDFKTGVEDVDDYFKLFEMTIDLVQPTSGANAEADREVFLKSWFPLKLDEKGMKILNGINIVPETTWDQIKTAFKQALVDPQEEYNWHARRQAITWDGVESFLDLATRIKKSVDKYEIAAARPREYFFRFRMALPKDYRRAIDIGLTKDKRKIDEAQGIAERIRLADAEANDESQGAAAASKTVSFSGMAMTDSSHDRLKTLEMAVQGINLQVKDLQDKSPPRSGGERVNRDYRGRDYSSSRERYEPRGRRPESRNRDYDRQRQGDSRGRRDYRDDRERYRSYSRDTRDPDDRSRRDSFVNRDNRSFSRNGYDSREYSRSRYDSRDRNRYDSRDRNRYDSCDRNRYDSRDRNRYDSRDRQYSRNSDGGRGRSDDRNRSRYDSRDRYDSRNRDRYDSRSQGRYDSRDRGRRDSRDGQPSDSRVRDNRNDRRPDSRERRNDDKRDSRADDRSGNRDRRPNGDETAPKQEPHRANIEHRLASLDDSQWQWLQGAISEKHNRDREDPLN